MKIPSTERLFNTALEERKKKKEILVFLISYVYKTTYDKCTGLIIHEFHIESYIFKVMVKMFSLRLIGSAMFGATFTSEANP